VNEAAAVGTKGFLFCDLRGYTAFVERRGDQAAAELLATYRELVRSAIAGHAGAEIKTEGDSVYVVFPAASGAVEAGLAIVAGAAERSAAERPIAVGVGIHAGETVATTEGLVGGAVNIAARVCAKARAGEVLVTDTVRALTRTFLPYTYTSLGTQQLKGIAGGIPLYRVEAVPSSARARLARQLGARRGRLAILAGLVVVALVAATGVYALNRPSDCLSLPASTKDVVAKIDPARNCVVAAYEVGRRPGPIVAAPGGFWVAALDDWTVSWLDPSFGRSTTVGVPGTPLAVTDDPLGNAYVLLRDERTIGGGTVDRNRVLKVEIDGKHAGYLQLLRDDAAMIAPGYWGLTYAGGRVWITDASAVGRVISLRLGEGWVPIQVDGVGLGPIEASTGGVWVANTSTPMLYALEGVSGRPTQHPLDPAHGGVTAMIASDAYLWLARSDGALTRLDPETGSLDSFIAAGPVSALASGTGSLWTADRARGVVHRVDQADGATEATIPVGGHPAGLVVAADGSVWVTIQGPFMGRVGDPSAR
jgi:class 3 adenylate cyclase/streptogramin lyase